jgi:hypothetical protein
MGTSKATKRQYWQDQIKAWQASNLSQSAYCSQSGIKLANFSYWRSVLLNPEEIKPKQFAPVKVIKDKSSSNLSQTIQIKLMSGHVIFLPLELEMNEIAKLIHLLEQQYA